MRPRKETREEAQARAQRAEQAAFALSMCLRAAVTGVDWTCLAAGKADNECHAIYATGLARADGGYVAHVCQVDGQGANVAAWSTEDFLDQRKQYIPARLDAAAVLFHRLTEAVVRASYRAQARDVG